MVNDLDSLNPSSGAIQQASAVKEVEYDPNRLSDFRVDSTNVDLANGPDPILGDLYETFGERYFSLDDVKLFALSNNEVIRRDADFLSPINGSVVESTTTLADYDIAQSGFLFGQRGVNAANSDFDWRWNKQIAVGENDLIQNNRFLSGGIPPGGTLQNRTGQYLTSATKNTQWGGQIRLSHELDYLASNIQDAFYPSSFNGRIRGEIRQPLLAGAGRQVTSVAGPLNGTIDGVTGVSQGVLIAKLQTEEAREQLNLAVSQLLRDVEILYNQLSTSNEIIDIYDGATRSLEELISRSEAAVESKAKGGIFDLLQAKQARDGILLSRMNELRNNRTISARLQRLIGYPNTIEGLQLRGLGDPVPFMADVDHAHQSAIHSRSDFRILELRERSLRAQYLATRNLNRPQLDFVTGYNVNGFGDNMFAPDIPGPDSATASVYRNLFDGQNTGWDARFELASVAGRRLARTREKNIAAQLHKLAIVRRDRCNELLFELRQITNDIDLIYQTCQIRKDQFERSMAVIRSLEARQLADFQIENSVLLANAIQTNVNDDAELKRSRAEYYNALCELLYRQGRIVEDNNLSVRF
ncbi:MAG: TolC family protein [Pirellula sp.]|nr:TolC family protein [Pirellula sp.]